ncbi:hypothetical protein SRHO_G00270340 [Serrasalmus rhombeus]
MTHQSGTAPSTSLKNAEVFRSAESTCYFALSWRETLVVLFDGKSERTFTDPRWRAARKLHFPEDCASDVVNASIPTGDAETGTQIRGADTQNTHTRNFSLPG